MSKSEVYSWRLTTELKRQLEEEARRLGVSVGAVLQTAARDWIARNAANTDDAAEH